MEALNTKKISRVALLACTAVVEEVLTKLGSLDDQQRVSLSDLHELIGKARTVPVYRKETKTNDDGTTEEIKVETGETETVVDRWDIIKAILAAVEEVQPGAFVPGASRGPGAGFYRGSKPAPVEKADMTPEEKKAARQANKGKKAAELHAEALQKAIAQLKAMGVAVPDNFTLPSQ